MKVFAEYDKTRNSVSASNIEEKKSVVNVCVVPTSGSIEVQIIIVSLPLTQSVPFHIIYAAMLLLLLRMR